MNFKHNYFEYYNYSITVTLNFFFFLFNVEEIFSAENVGKRNTFMGQRKLLANSIFY